MAKSLKYGIFIILLGLLLSACASKQKPIVSEVSRIRDFQFDRAGDQPRAAYIPKGAYLLGLMQNTAYAPGTWVQFTPGSLWPDEEPRPTVLTGRVAERSADKARLEVLALQPGVRDPLPNFEGYAQQTAAQSLHAMTKRLVFASSSDAMGARTELTKSDLIEGNELYGAFASDGSQRLANKCTALL